jgi:hypothetical protein
MTWRETQSAILALGVAASIARSNAATAQTSLCDGSALPAGSATSGSFCVPLGIGSTAPVTGSLLTLGASGGTNGAIVLNGSTSGEALLTVGSAAGNAVKFQLSSSNGSSGYILQTNGSGVTSWVANSGGIGTITLGTSASVTNPSRASEINTGLYSDASGALGFSSLGSAKLYIDASEVGIGSTAPIAPLDIAATLNSDTAGRVQYFNGINVANFVEFPGLLSQVTATKQNASFGGADGMLGWVDEPASNTSEVGFSQGLEGLVTIETTVTNNWGAIGVDGEVYPTGLINESTGSLIGVNGYAEEDTAGVNNDYLAGGVFAANELGGTDEGVDGILVTPGIGAGTSTGGMDGVAVFSDVWGGTLTNGMNGIYVEPDIDGGSVDTRVGVFIAQGDGSPTGGDWGLYQPIERWELFRRLGRHRNDRAGCAARIKRL